MNWFSWRNNSLELQRDTPTALSLWAAHDANHPVHSYKIAIYFPLLYPFTPHPPNHHHNLLKQIAKTHSCNAPHDYHRHPFYAPFPPHQQLDRVCVRARSHTRSHFINFDATKIIILLIFNTKSINRVRNVLINRYYFARCEKHCNQMRLHSIHPIQNIYTIESTLDKRVA